VFVVDRFLDVFRVSRYVIVDFLLVMVQSGAHNLLKSKLENDNLFCIFYVLYILIARSMQSQCN